MSDPSVQFMNIRSELEEVRKNFLRLSGLIPNEALDRKFPGEGWTIKQELVHIVQALEILPKGIRRAVMGKGRSALSFIPTGVRSWFNGFILIPLASRRATRTSIAQAYEQAFNTLLDLLLRNYLKKHGTREQPILGNIERSNKWLIGRPNISRSMPRIYVVCSTLIAKGINSLWTAGWLKNRCPPYKACNRRLAASLPHKRWKKRRTHGKEKSRFCFH